MAASVEAAINPRTRGGESRVDVRSGPRELPESARFRGEPDRDLVIHPGGVLRRQVGLEPCGDRSVDQRNPGQEHRGIYEEPQDVSRTTSQERDRFEDDGCCCGHGQDRKTEQHERKPERRHVETRGFPPAEKLHHGCDQGECGSHRREHHQVAQILAQQIHRRAQRGRRKAFRLRRWKCRARCCCGRRRTRTAATTGCRSWRATCRRTRCRTVPPGTIRP